MKNKLIAFLLSLVFIFTCFTACAPNQNGDSTGGSGSGGGTVTPPPSTGGGMELNFPTEIPVATEPSLQIHYKRTTGKYTDWGFWLWGLGKDGALYELNYADDFGAVGVYPLSNFFTGFTGSETLGIIPRRLDSWTKDGESDRLLAFSEMVMDENNYYHVYIKEGDIELYMTDQLIKSDKIKFATFTDETHFSVSTSQGVDHYDVYHGNEVIASVDLNGATWFRYTFEEPINIGDQYYVEVKFKKSQKVIKAPVSIQMLYSTQAFNDKYYYDGQLGAIYTSQSTTFRVWSPVATKILLNLYNDGYNGASYNTVEMSSGEKGTFETTVSGDLEGKYYTYTVYNSNFPAGKEIVDPYARSAGLSGVRGQVVDFSKTNPDGWDQIAPIDYDRKELTVWETHVADVTSSATWTGSEANRKKYLGLIEGGTTYTQGGVTVSTGFDHIKELGVNAVQLIPIFDQANDEANPTFNWGYNPLNYNVLEGSYSSDPTDGYVRIREFKEVVKAYNKAGINIIMDVVYNHVNGANGSNFDVLMPGYYFRYNSDGSLSNGSGCGNETASENAMYRKFMIDSACFWASEYKLGGFRFDLMGLHDIETMNLLTAALKEVNPNIVVYGEPWCGGTSTLPSSDQAVQANGNLYEGYGQFNDQMRDALIKGGLSAASERGWITTLAGVNSSDVTKIVAGIQGTTKGAIPIADANKTVNYVTCHDNYTLYDRIIAAGITDEAVVRKMNVLANSVVFTSRGTTFMLAGDEFLRTKGGDHNSYTSSYKVNELDYALKIKNLDVFNNYKALIAFKQGTSVLHMDATAQSDFAVTSMNGGAVIKITFTDHEAGRAYKIVHANSAVADYKEAFAGYTLYLDTLSSGVELSDSTPVSAYQTIIAYKTIG